ncbi:MAG: type II toxin-antitoxin system HicB family antitoxin [Candidatus Xenobiia bacterium LiM19]
MEHLRYTVILEREEQGGYHAFCPILKGCHTQGETVEEALKHIKEAIELYLESLKAHNESIPVEDFIIKPMDIAI